MAGEDLTSQYSDQAVYLPSLQQGYPQHPKYKSKTDIRYLEDIESPTTKLISINEFHAKHGAQMDFQLLVDR
jgi:hypothetical protein